MKQTPTEAWIKAQAMSTSNNPTKITSMPPNKYCFSIAQDQAYRDGCNDGYDRGRRAGEKQVRDNICILLGRIELEKIEQKFGDRNTSS